MKFGSKRAIFGVSPKIEDKKWGLNSSTLHKERLLHTVIWPFEVDFSVKFKGSVQGLPLILVIYCI